MKIKPYVEKLSASKEYKNFVSKNPRAFMVAGFFVLDLEEGANIHQIDFFVPDENKIAAFGLDKKVSLQLLDITKKEKGLERLDINTNVDLDALEGILEDEMKNRGISEKIKKIIAVLQVQDGKKIWNLNCVLSGMEILKAHVEDESKSVLKMDKVSLMDMVKKIPADKLKAMQGLGKNTPEAKENLGEEDIEDKIKKLDKLEGKIEEEKKRLRSGLKKK